MQERSLEWLVRLIQDPRRLWKRYLVTNIKFIWYVRREGKYQKRLTKILQRERIGQKKHVFIIGSKGIPAAYGGFETFVEKLTEYQKSDNIQYHVACMGTENSTYEHNHAECFNFKIPELGSPKAVYYDLVALKYCIRYCKKHTEIKTPVFYVLACRIGPFITFYKRKIRRLGGQLYINPDGHEWKRAKWSVPIQRYWKISERLMVRSADLVICDSINIETYIKESYSQYSPQTEFIAYGSETSVSKLRNDDSVYLKWMNHHGLQPGEYYLMVGRFVPENNFKVIIREFMASASHKDLAIITTANDIFLKELEAELHFSKDSRIKFVGTVYEQELLKKIRENAYGYFHGHEVGGTNPSLLEALGSTDLNLLLGVGFNREVAEDAALYWNKEAGNLAGLIDQSDQLEVSVRRDLGDRARKRIRENYSWEYIVDRYEVLWERKDK
ncbi:MAG: DUF1972 domain-containing protein [Lachnospiraceae bacterium]|nr:DUF1972 domain-containing protein [Lachnospiraceae bacterium]